MIPIHRTILLRLLAAWALVSACVAAGVYYLENRKINDYVVALAVDAASDFSSRNLYHGRHTPEQLARLQEEAEEFARRNFVVIEVYDASRNRLVEAVNPAYAAIEEALQRHPDVFPMDTGSRYRKWVIEGHTVVRVLTPLRTAAGDHVGYFEGVFVVDEATLADLQERLLHTLAAALAAVLLTATVLYPVILGLNRHLLEASREIVKGNLEMASTLGEAIAKRDSDTGAHNFRVALYAIRLGEAVGIPRPAMRHLILGAFLHDVGKIGISDRILLKPAELDPEEKAIMRTHVELGVEIVAKSEWLLGARDVILCHHEKFDGSGYLQGLAGESIPLNARIFAVVDVFDALTSKRPYKDAWPVDLALSEIDQEAGSHFDPELVSRFRAIARGLYAEIGHAGEAELMERLRQEAIRYFLPPASNGR